MASKFEGEECFEKKDDERKGGRRTKSTREMEEITRIRDNEKERERERKRIRRWMQQENERTRRGGEEKKNRKTGKETR